MFLTFRKLKLKTPRQQNSNYYSSFVRECQQHWKDFSIGATTLSIATFSIMSLCITIKNATLSILTFTAYAECFYAVIILWY